MIRFQSVPRDLTLFCRVGKFLHAYQEFFVPTNSTVSSPAIVSFADLNLLTTTFDALERMKISTPTKIQADTLPILLEGRDVIGQSRTGSGKTLAFGIPAVESVDPALRAVQVLVLTPTRELAVQVGDVLADLAKGTGIRTVLVYGGRAMGPQKDALRRGAQIVVGTPGRVADLHGQGDLRLDNVRFLVLDEADEMLDRGFAPQVNKILSWTPRDRQTALFSATMPAWVNEASHKHLHNPQHVAIQATQAEQTQIDHIAYDVPSGGKIDALKDLLDARGDGQVIVFGRTKHGVKKLAKQLLAAGYPVAALQGNLSQNARDQVMADFKAGKVSILLATNVAARGIDVTAVDHVINFELPEPAELLQHRIGRTGRMDRPGSAITLLGSEDADKWRQLMRGLGKQIQRSPWNGARRTDSTPRVVTHAAAAPQEITERRSPERRPTTRIDGANGHQADSRRSHRGQRQPADPMTERPAASNGSRGRQPSRRESQPAASGPIQRRRSTISVVSEMINERRGETRPSARASAPESRTPASNPTGRPMWAPLQVDAYVDSEQFPRRDRGNSRHSNPRRNQNGAGEANGYTTGRHASGNDRARESSPSDQSAEQHTATCSKCGGVAVLRFAPDLSRPIYCDACFSERRKQNRRPANARQ
jgi:CxxC-x17-CxxC domain-containing protein